MSSDPREADRESNCCVSAYEEKPRHALIVADSSVDTSFFGAVVAFDATALVPAAAAPNTVSNAFTTDAIILIFE